MAKGNLFLGTGSGKVGDIVLYRADGEQLSRVRNRHPRNPNSTKQSIQRAVSATVSQLYSIGQELFNHSYEGITKGKETQRKFSKDNMKILRAAVINDINGGFVNAACVGRVCAPGLSFAVPFVGAQVSKGTYDNRLFAYDATVFGFKMPAPGQAETITEYVTRLGLVAGDIYTFGAIGCDSNSDTARFSVEPGNEYASVYMPTFGYTQLMVKSGLAGDALASTLKFSDLFVNAGGNADISYLAVTDDVSIDDILTVGSDHGCIFCIRSRWDSDLRSTSFLEAGTSALAYGLTSDHLLAAWRDKAGLNDVELILDGSNFNGVSINGETYTLKLGHGNNQESRYFGYFVVLLTDSNGVDHMPILYTPGPAGEIEKSVAGFPMSQQNPGSIEALMAQIEAGTAALGSSESDPEDYPGKTALQLDDANPIEGIDHIVVGAAWSWGDADPTGAALVATEGRFYNSVMALTE